MKKLAIIPLLATVLSINTPLYSQDTGGWLYVATAPPNTIWRPNDIIETESDNIVIAYWDYQKASHISKLSASGVLLNEVTVSAPDTTIIIKSLFADEGKDSDGFRAIGLCYPDTGDVEAILFMRFDENCNVVQQKAVPCVGLLHSIANLCVLKQRDGFKIAVTENDFRRHHLAKFDEEGTLLKWEELELDSLLSICNLFETLEEDGSFGMYANISNSSQASMGVLIFDDSLQFVERRHFHQWNSVEPNGDICLSYLKDEFNSMMMPSPDRMGYLVSSRLEEGLYSSSQWIKSDQSSIVAKTDSSFTMYEHYEVIEHLNDTIEYPAFYKSIDFSTKSVTLPYVYQCSMQGNCLGEPGWPFCQYPLNVVVTKTDANLNIVWKKRFLTDKVYSPFAIASTSDGGCVVVGMVYDFNLEHRIDLFALKINENGNVGLKEIHEENMAFVYPNPVKETLKIGGEEAFEVQVYNTLGQLVKTAQNTNEVSLEGLPQGVYLLRIATKDGRVFSDKVVKK